jgi:hypothetical protein
MRLTPVVLLGGLIVTAVVCAGAVAAPGRQVARHWLMDDQMEMIGDQHEFPDLAAAGRANVARARRLLRASRGTADRFDTVSEAKRRGYVANPTSRPGFVHFRRNGTRFSGRVFDAAAPQALVFWCPSQGRCTLAIYMYRAPAGKAPDTWGDLLMWHRHNGTGTASWMTHVWLLRDVREGFATCAPAMALERDLGIHLEPYRSHVTTTPCTTEGGMAGGDDTPMPDMPGATASAARVCPTPRYPGTGYFTSLTVERVSCSAGRSVALAYYRCRTRTGPAGRCRSRVRGYRCRERRNAIPTEIDARVTCRRGARRVTHTYQQDL